MSKYLQQMLLVRCKTEITGATLLLFKVIFAVLSAASLAFKSCAKDKETVNGL